MVLTTSNITGAIDLAFVDRADLQLYVGPPGRRAIHQILTSVITELTNKQVFNFARLELSPQHLTQDLQSLYTS
jgi:hypothetical protein